MRLIGIDIAGKPARNRPDGPGIERLQQRRVRHESGYAAVAVEEGMNPGETMMRGGGREDSVGLAEAPIAFLEALEEARYRRRAYGHMPADRDIARAQFTRDDFHPLLRRWVLDPQQI